MSREHGRPALTWRREPSPSGSDPTPSYEECRDRGITGRFETTAMAEGRDLLGAGRLEETHSLLDLLEITSEVVPDRSSFG